MKWFFILSAAWAIMLGGILALVGLVVDVNVIGDGLLLAIAGVILLALVFRPDRQDL